MRLPTSSDLNNFNYVLAIISNISVSGWCSINAVNQTCRKKTFNAQIIDYRKIIELAEYCGLVATKKGKVSLTTKGTEFLNLNRQGFLEMNQEQKRFLAENSVFHGRYKSPTQQTFEGFVPDHDEMTYKYVVSNEYEISTKDKVMFHFLEWLGVITQTNAGFVVKPQYVKLVREIRAERKGITQEELELRIDANRKLGFKAEELIVEFERKRLRALGLNAEADRVRRISVLEPTAGYDIRSFVGDGPAADYDKFIEVKSFQGSVIEFYWTKNEIDVSRQMGDSYWIYFISDFNERLTVEDIRPLIIQNPSKSIFDNAQFKCEPRVFKVSQATELKVEY